MTDRTTAQTTIPTTPTPTTPAPSPFQALSYSPAKKPAPCLFPNEPKLYITLTYPTTYRPAHPTTPSPSLISSTFGALPTLNQIVLAFRAFFSLLFSGKLSDDMLTTLGLIVKPAPVPPPPPKPEIKPEDGALQLLGILQRDARILDFFMEDIGPYSDEQVGAAARDVHTHTRDILVRHFAPAPVIDAVEGSVANPPDGNAALVKYIGNVPATGKPPAGVLRHRGWRATAATLPQLNSRQDLVVLAPAEIEVE